MHLKTSSAKWRPFCPGGKEIGIRLCRELIWVDEECCEYLDTLNITAEDQRRVIKDYYET